MSHERGTNAGMSAGAAGKSARATGVRVIVPALLTIICFLVFGLYQFGCLKREAVGMTVGALS